MLRISIKHYQSKVIVKYARGLFLPGTPLDSYGPDWVNKQMPY